MAWKHAHGFYGCDLKAPYYSQTSAEPPVVISSPAYLLPGVKSRADEFATNYMAEQNAAGKGVPEWLHPHISWAYLMGQQDERLKGGAR